MAKRNGKLLTKSDVRRLKPPATSNCIQYDGGPDSVAGFGIRVTANGAKSFILNYYAAGRERRYTIGGWPTWTVTNARKEARQLRHRIDKGEDPLADRKAANEAPTVNDLIERFRKEDLPRKAATTRRDYNAMIDLHIAPALGPIKVHAVTHPDIDTLHRRITESGTKYRANRVVALCSRLFSLAIRWGHRSDNPARGVERNREHGRRRYLKGDELTALLKALAAYPDRDTANIFRVLLATGARRGEVLSMRWSDIDLDKGLWSKPPEATKQAMAHEAPLAKAIQLLLVEIRKQQTSNSKRRELPEYVFPGAGRTGHVTEIKKAWRRICRDAGITGLRIHDLRHSFASQLVSSGASLPLIASLLGHASAQTAARYSHLFADPQKAAVEKVAAILDQAENGHKPPPASAPIPFGKAKRRGRRG
jgi:integrase